MKRHNWPAMKADYVEGWQNGGEARHLPSLSELAAKYQIDERMLAGRCSKEGWLDARKALQADIDSARRTALVSKIGTASAVFDAACLRTAKTAIRVGRGMLARAVAEMRRIDGEETAAVTFKERAFYANLREVNSRVYARLVGSLEKAQNIGRIAIAASGDDGSEDFYPIPHAYKPIGAADADPDA